MTIKPTFSTLKTSREEKEALKWGEGDRREEESSRETKKIKLERGGVQLRIAFIHNDILALYSCNLPQDFPNWTTSTNPQIQSFGAFFMIKKKKKKNRK